MKSQPTHAQKEVPETLAEQSAELIKQSKEPTSEEMTQRLIKQLTEKLDKQDEKIKELEKGKKETLLEEPVILISKFLEYGNSDLGVKFHEGKLVVRTEEELEKLKSSNHWNKEFGYLGRFKFRKHLEPVIHQKIEVR